MARPRSGDWLEDEIASWRDQGVAMVVSLLEDAEVFELGLRDEERFCENAGIAFTRFPIADRGVPDSAAAAIAVSSAINEFRVAGRDVAVHCRAGIGRSSLMAAMALYLTGLPVSAAFDLISDARGVAVPDTDDQRAWVLRAVDVQ